jgi:hypothetical protein
MATLNELQKELKFYKDTLVLDLFEVVRLVGVLEDEDDNYWIFDTEHGIVHSSCVMNWTPLKGYIPTEQYDRLVRIWNFNHTTIAI